MKCFFPCIVAGTLSDSAAWLSCSDGLGTCVLTTVIPRTVLHYSLATVVFIYRHVMQRGLGRHQCWKTGVLKEKV